ncbi:hypothetical protein F4861DRAFT_324211 [Xylaria intraflava]|nr:hypothetical protein F4861DRAFT_324211 [Xylaria intraflava]
MQLRSIFVFFSVLATATSTPVRSRCSLGPKPPTPGNPGITYVLPITDGTQSLPAPNKTIKHIAVGHGVQNYTCTATGAQAASVGALAVLYDITGLYPGSGSGALSQSDWDTLTSKVLRTTDDPITEPTTQSGSPFPPAASLHVPGVSGYLPFLGHHYFNAAVPTFSLGNGAEVLSVQKVQGIPAPHSADAGLHGEGAVDWLFLADSAGNEVYRVLTSGGDPAACGAAGQTQSVDYTAMYWFY